MQAIRKIFDGLHQAVHEEEQKLIAAKQNTGFKKFMVGVKATTIDAFDTFLFAPNTTTPAKGAHIRDGIDLKRLMITVVIAMIPCLLFGIYNTGYQHYLATGKEGTLIDYIITGAIAVLPVVVVSYAVGLTVEFIFASIRRHPVNEGYLVSGMLIPLTLPPTIPLWQVALASIFAVVVAKEVFGGTGMNIFNVALTARAFLYFAYPAYMAGSKVWVAGAENGVNTIDGYTGATALGLAAEHSNSGKTESIVSFLDGAGWGAAKDLFSFENLFIGFVPGSIGETSTLMCLIGAAILIFTGVGSWKIIVSTFGGAYLTGFLFNLLAPNAASFAALPAHYHLVMGGFAFGAVFMATDPVSAAQTELGKWIYGFLIGAVTVLIRVFNPAYPEGIMLAILLMNVLAPLIDYYVVDANKKRRLKRAVAA
jgi:Na+-transporting NADH:ubiquinone oxidoreductase subunit B